MALTRTTLSAAIKASDLLLPVASTATGFPPVGVITSPQQVLMIDDELMFVVQVPVAGSVQVRCRGADGTVAIGHDIFSSVITSPNPNDFPGPAAGTNVLRPPMTFQDVVTYGQDGTIAAPVDDVTVASLSKATAGAYTLGTPSLGLNGMILILTSTTAAAHVITATALLMTGVAGSPFTTCTFPPQIGATVTLNAQNGFWNVQGTQGTMTFA